MNRVLLLLAHRENCRLLSEWLSVRYQVFFPPSGCPATSLETLLEARQKLDNPFDLCILDGPTLDRLWKWVQAKRQAEQPMLLPFLLVTSRQDVGMASRHLWQSVDELIISPIEKVELQARVEILLRSRRLSLELNVANEKLHSEITQHQRTQDALVNSEAKLNSLIENSSDIIAILEDDGTIRYKSPSTQQILGFSPEELE
ncbi:MAG TPA: PAS domain S-box protein, partial [Coleofasciculaceae cyanobacterium]